MQRVGRNRDFCFFDQSVTSIQTGIFRFLRVLLDKPPRPGVSEQFFGLQTVGNVYIRDGTASLRIRKGQGHYFSLPVIA
jgi:hypothetical protein